MVKRKSLLLSPASKDLCADLVLIALNMRVFCFEYKFRMSCCPGVVYSSSDVLAVCLWRKFRRESKHNRDVEEENVNIDDKSSIKRNSRRQTLSQPPPLCYPITHSWWLHG